MTTPIRYLILYKGEANFTHWFDDENHYHEGMIVFDLLANLFTEDGENWKIIEEDHL